MDNKNAHLSNDFFDYCLQHPEERFWQALRNWSEINFILASESLDAEDAKDTFYWKNKNS